MDEIKIKRVKKDKKPSTIEEKVLAGLGVGSTLIGGAGMVQPPVEPTQIVGAQSAETNAKTSSIKETLRSIFGVEQAQAAGDASTDAAQAPTLKFVNVTTGDPQFLLVGDVWQITITGQPGQNVYATNVQGGKPDLLMGTIGSSGTLTLNGSVTADQIGVWDETWTIGDSADTATSLGRIDFEVLAKTSAAPTTPTVSTPAPTINFKNVTTGDPQFLLVGDSWEITITGQPGQNVYGTNIVGGKPTTLMGTIGSDGTLTLKGTITADQVGVWDETWSIGDSADTATNLGKIDFQVLSKTTSVSFKNTNGSSTFQVGDSWAIDIQNANANAPVYAVGGPTGSPQGVRYLGMTDANGNFHMVDTLGSDAIGNWQEKLKIGNTGDTESMAPGASTGDSTKIAQVTGLNTVGSGLVFTVSPKATAPSTKTTTASLSFKNTNGSSTFKVGDSWVIDIQNATKNAPVYAIGGVNGEQGLRYLGMTDASGNFHMVDTLQNDAVGSWNVQLKIGNSGDIETLAAGDSTGDSTKINQVSKLTSLGSPLVFQVSSQAATVSFTNSDSHSSSAKFYVGDTLIIDVKGAIPNAPLYATNAPQGTQGVEFLGMTDANGNFHLEKTVTSDMIGSWSQQLKIGKTGQTETMPEGIGSLDTNKINEVTQLPTVGNLLSYQVQDKYYTIKPVFLQNVTFTNNKGGGTITMGARMFVDQATAEALAARYGGQAVQVPLTSDVGTYSIPGAWYIQFSDGTQVDAAVMARSFYFSPEDTVPGKADAEVQAIITQAMQQHAAQQQAAPTPTATSASASDSPSAVSTNDSSTDFASTANTSASSANSPAATQSSTASQTSTTTNTPASTQTASASQSNDQATIAALDSRIQNLTQQLANQQQQTLQLQQQLLATQQQLLASNSANANTAEISALMTQIQNLQVQNAQMASQLQQLVSQRSTVQTSVATAQLTNIQPTQGLQMPAGYAASSDQVSSNQVAPGTTYTVKKGDTLWNIAKKYYGDGRKWRKVLEANTKNVRSPNTLQVGTELVIPQ